MTNCELYERYELWENTPSEGCDLSKRRSFCVWLSTLLNVSLNVIFHYVGVI
jgi:hypothetical protein